MRTVGSKIGRIFCCVAFLFVLAASPARADYPAPRESDWVARDFRFHSGEVFPELKVHYRTVGAPSGEPVLILHGTAGSGASMLTKDFAGELFGPGQPLDAARYFIILPDARIEAQVLAINAGDDERNPPELGILEREIKRVKNGRYLLVPGSDQTRGHGTTGMAKLYAKELGDLLERAPRKAQ